MFKLTKKLLPRLSTFYFLLSTLLLPLPCLAAAPTNACNKNLVLLGYNFGVSSCDLTFASLIGFVLYIGQNLILLGGIVAIIYMMIGGLKIVASRGNEDQYKQGINTLSYAIVGFVIVVTAYTIVYSLLKYVTGVNINTDLPTIS